MGCSLALAYASDPAPDKSISINEWRELIASDREMLPLKSAERTLVNGDSSNFKNDGLAMWTSYSSSGTKGPAIFFFNNGRIVCKNADKEILHKMLDLSEKLKAKVEGEEGQEFVRSEDFKVTIKKNEGVNYSDNPWWKLDRI